MFQQSPLQKSEFIVVQLFSFKAMMYRIRGLKDLISFKNQQCTCFGSVLQAEEKFLASKKTFKMPSHPITNRSNLVAKEQSFFKKGFKKSLKKHFSPLFHQHKTGRTMDANRSPCEIEANDQMERQKEIRDLLHQQTKLGDLNQKTYIIHEEHVTPLYTLPRNQFRHAINEQQHNQASYKTLPPFLPSSPRPIIYVPMITSPKIIKINYNSPVSNPVISDSAKNEVKRETQPVSMKNINRSLSNGNISQNLNEFLLSKVDEEQQLRKSESSKEFQSNFPLKELSKMVSESEKQIKQESKQKEQKFKLKRMDEVAEIYSEIDSEQLSDSDVQSVVLGRLNEYSSTIDQDFSEISTVERSTQGKLIRINSLMTNFDFVRNPQGTSSQFLSY